MAHRPPPPARPRYENRRDGRGLRGCIGKIMSVVIFEGRKQVTTLHVLFFGIYILSRISFFPISAVQKIVLGKFSLSSQTNSLKTCITIPKRAIFNLAFLSPRDLDLKYAH